MLLFWVNSVLKSLVSAFTPVRNLGEGIGGIGHSAPPPLIFRPDWGPKGRRNFLGDRPPPPPPPPPLYLRIWMIAAPYLKVWMGTVPLGVISYSHGIKLEKVGPTVSSFKSMSVATEDRKQFQCLLLLEFNWYEDTFWLIKKIANSVASPLQLQRRHNRKLHFNYAKTGLHGD